MISLARHDNCTVFYRNSSYYQLLFLLLNEIMTAYINHESLDLEADDWRYNEGQKWREWKQIINNNFKI